MSSVVVANDGENERPGASSTTAVTGVAGRDCLPACVGGCVLHPTRQRVVRPVLLAFVVAFAVDFVEGTFPVTLERDFPRGPVPVRRGDRGRAGGLVAINHRRGSAGYRRLGGHPP